MKWRKKKGHPKVPYLFQGDLKFFVNGDCQGVAAANLPQMLYAVVDMYGKCAQVTVTAPSTPDSSEFTLTAVAFCVEYFDLEINVLQGHLTCSLLSDINWLLWNK